MTTRTNSPLLSKSRFITGQQCHLHLWYQCYHPDLASRTSEAQQAVFDSGHEVGELATQLYPGGVRIVADHMHHEEAVQTTLKVMGNRQIPAMFEAAFLYDGIRIRVDILERLENGKWNLIEVKSSTSVKSVHFPDVAIQWYVLRGSGLEVDKAFLMHVNNQYVYDGKELDLNSLFVSSDVTEEVAVMQDSVQSMISELKEMLSGSDPPAVFPSRHCNSPYDCEFYDYCTKEMPEHWIIELLGISQAKLNDLAAMGINDIGDIPSTYPLTALPERIRTCVLNNREYISEGLERELTDVEYPIHFLDFETISTAIPRYAGTRPYQTIPFQWSNHILQKDGVLEHHDYLCNRDKDPREEFTFRLLSVLGMKGTIFIYSAYETRIIKALSEDFPEYQKKLLDTLDRFKDLCAILKKYCYHPDFHGSFSLKSVLPVLAPDMDYKFLEIQEGGQASLEYLRMIDPSASPEEREKIREDLLIYCEQDTLAMVRIRDEMLKRFD
jgi:CRISPR/Cas system-associated exonuclease Cas4 (RecB family)